MGVGVRKRTETVVVLLAGRIPKRQLNMLSINLDVGDVVFEDGGDIDLSKLLVGWIQIRSLRHDEDVVDEKESRHRTPRQTRPRCRGGQ